MPALVFDPGASAESVRVLLLTRTGEVGFLVERLPGLAPVVTLPGLFSARALDPETILRRRLREEAGIEALDLVPMSRYGIPTGDRGRAAILLAPGARRRPLAGLAYVPVATLVRWLSARREEGWRVDILVRVALRLAERHFARWARVRLRTVCAHLRGRAGASATRKPELRVRLV